MAAFFVGSINVLDPEAFAEYSQKTRETFAIYGGESITRGKKSHDVLGDGGSQAVVFVRFKDMDALNTWYNSDEYQALVPLRERAINLTITAYEEL